MSNIFDHFANYKVRSKLTVLNIIFLFSLIILGSAVNLLFKSSQTITILSNEYRFFVEELGSGNQNYLKYKLSGNENDLNLALTHLKKANELASTFGNIDSLLKAMPKKEWLPYMYKIYGKGVGFDQSKIELMGDQIIIASNINPKVLDELKLISKKASNYLDKSIHLISSDLATTNNQLTDIQNYLTAAQNTGDTFSVKLFALSKYLFKMLFLLIFILVLVLGGTVTFISIRISNSISKPINKLAENFKKIAAGNLNTSLHFDSKNEIGELSNAFLKIQIDLQDIVTYSKKVAIGDYSSKLEPKSADDELTISLNKMTDKLVEIKLKTENENWTQKGINGLNDEMRGNATIKLLSKKIITYLSNFVGFEIGAIYVYDEVLKHLELTGSIGLNTKELQQTVQRCAAGR